MSLFFYPNEPAVSEIKTNSRRLVSRVYYNIEIANNLFLFFVNILFKNFV